jgi:hypothetical protein
MSHLPSRDREAVPSQLPLANRRDEGAVRTRVFQQASSSFGKRAMIFPTDRLSVRLYFEHAVKRAV